jgi:hypothetical protein
MDYGKHELEEFWVLEGGDETARCVEQLKSELNAR